DEVTAPVDLHRADDAVAAAQARASDPADHEGEALSGGLDGLLEGGPFGGLLAEGEAALQAMGQGAVGQGGGRRGGERQQQGRRRAERASAHGFLPESSPATGRGWDEESQGAHTATPEGAPAAARGWEQQLPAVQSASR